MSAKSDESIYRARAFYLGKKMFKKGLNIGFAIGIIFGIVIGFAFFYGWYFVSSHMADIIKELFWLPKEEQEAVLDNLSREYSPLEINGEVFMVPKEVNDLIDSLVMQLNELRVRSGEMGKIGKESY